jgi:hypothetical protein
LPFRTPSTQSLLPSAESLERCLAGLRRIMALLLRDSRVLQALYRDTERRVRRSPRLAAGVAAAVTLAVFGTLIGTAVGSGGPAAAVSDEVAAAPAQPAGSPAGQAPAGHAPAAGQPGTRPHGSPAPASTGPASTAPAQAAPAKTAAPEGHAAPAGPHLIYDSTNPAQIPGRPDIAAYADGPHPVPASQVTGRNVMWIDITGSSPAAPLRSPPPRGPRRSSAPTPAASRASTPCCRTGQR